MKSRIPGIMLICLGVIFFVIFQGRPLGMLATLITIIAGLIVLARAMRDPEDTNTDKKN